MTTETHRYKRPTGPCAFTESQWNTLCHLVDAIVPSLTPQETADLKRDYKEHVTKPVDEKYIDAFAKESATQCAEFIEDLNNMFNTDIPPEKVSELAGVLDWLKYEVPSIYFQPDSRG